MVSSQQSHAVTPLFDRLWQTYSAMNPQAGAIHSLLLSRGEQIVNDHVAFRTFADERVGIDVLAAPFLELGYRPAESYRFEKKKLDARHFEHPDLSLPKVFISELRWRECSPVLQQIVSGLLDQVPERADGQPELCASGRPWNVTFREVTTLADESEYAGWMAAFGFCANHFTVLVNALETVSSLQELNQLIQLAGFPLNQEGGEIKGSPGEFLEQSSTLAPPVSVPFTDGEFPIPGCYYEFARRYPLPDGRLFSGFVTNSADKIFQSTDRRG